MDILSLQEQIKKLKEEFDSEIAGVKDEWIFLV